MFQEALATVLSRLEAARTAGLLQAYALIGGFAVSAWGVPRATRDIDFAVAIGAADPQALATFVGGQYETGGQDDPLQGVIHASIDSGADAISLQLIFLPTHVTEIIFQRVERLSVMEQVVPVVSWQSLVLLKLYAGGPQDQLDAHQILKVRRPQPEELREITEITRSLGLLEEWTLLLALDQKGEQQDTE